MSDIKAEIVEYWTDGVYVYATLQVPVEFEEELRGQVVNLSVVPESEFIEPDWDAVKGYI